MLSDTRGKQDIHLQLELYYSLLGNQLPPEKIATIIKTVLKCFLPSVDLKQLTLPSESCASYMRRQELTALNMVHKDTSILEQAEKGPLHLNSDGTTKSQRKVEGVAINGMVLSVNEVSDGSADCMVEDISREFQMLRDVAHALNMPNADKLNWTDSILIIRLCFNTKTIQQASRTIKRGR